MQISNAWKCIIVKKWRSENLQKNTTSTGKAQSWFREVYWKWSMNGDQILNLPCNEDNEFILGCYWPPPPSMPKALGLKLFYDWEMFRSWWCWSNRWADWSTPGIMSLPSLPPLLEARPPPIMKLSPFWLACWDWASELSICYALGPTIK